MGLNREAKSVRLGLLNTGFALTQMENKKKIILAQSLGFSSVDHHVILLVEAKCIISQPHIIYITILQEKHSVIQS